MRLSIQLTCGRSCAIEFLILAKKSLRSVKNCTRPGELLPPAVHAKTNICLNMPVSDDIFDACLQRQIAVTSNVTPCSIRAGHK